MDGRRFLHADGSKLVGPERRSWRSLFAAFAGAALLAVGLVAAMPALGATSGSVPEQTTCYGTAGYNGAGTWSFQAVNPTIRTPVASPSPDTCVNVPESAAGGVLELISVPGNIALSGSGNLSCGNGTLSGSVGETGGPGSWWTGSWRATFTNGVGKVTGSVVPLVSGGSTHKLSGTIVVADGAGSSSVGFCNNDQNPSLAVVTLKVS
jgi:hypothetical protein